MTWYTRSPVRHRLGGDMGGRLSCLCVVRSHYKPLVHSLIHFLLVCHRLLPWLETGRYNIGSFPLNYFSGDFRRYWNRVAIYTWYIILETLVHDRILPPGESVFYLYKDSNWTGIHWVKTFVLTIYFTSSWDNFLVRRNGVWTGRTPNLGDEIPNMFIRENHTVLSVVWFLHTIL